MNTSLTIIFRKLASKFNLEIMLLESFNLRASILLQTIEAEVHARNTGKLMLFGVYDSISVPTNQYNAWQHNYERIQRQIEQVEAFIPRPNMRHAPTFAPIMHSIFESDDEDRTNVVAFPLDKNGLLLRTSFS
jgi:hypothetical protein